MQSNEWEIQNAIIVCFDAFRRRPHCHNHRLKNIAIVSDIDAFFALSYIYSLTHSSTARVL